MTVSGPVGSVPGEGVERCRIAGPYLPVGDVDWHCRTHGVDLVTWRGEDAPADSRRGDMVCPAVLPGKWCELGVSEWGTSVFMAPVGTTDPPPPSRLYVPPAWSDEETP